MYTSHGYRVSAQLSILKCFYNGSRFFVFYWNHFRKIDNRVNTSYSSELTLKTMNNYLPRSNHVHMDFVPRIELTNIFWRYFTVNLSIYLEYLTMYTMLYYQLNHLEYVWEPEVSSESGSES